MDSILYLEGRYALDKLYVTTPSFMALFTVSCYEYFELNVVIVDYGSKLEAAVLHEIKSTFGFNLESKTVENCPHMIQCCKLPATQVSGEAWCTSGLSSTVRHILQQKVSHDGDSLAKRLLGFRRGCLQACAEVSVWTKFCEVDVTKMVDKWVTNKCVGSKIILPEEFSRFENHLSCPPITHNVLKKKQEQLGKKLEKEEFTQMRRKKLQELPNLEHKFAEGLDLTLADLFIFSTFSFVFMSSTMSDCIRSHFPLIHKWYHLVKTEKFMENSLPLLQLCKGKPFNSISSLEFIIPYVPKESLYKGDPSRYKPRWRAFTNQKDIDMCLEKVNSLKFIELMLDIKDFNVLNNNLVDRISSIHIRKGNLEYTHTFEIIKLEFNDEINWRKFTNMQDQVPVKRSERKFQQLQNMAKYIISIAKPGNIIVDFCSGSGHLGLLLAYCLPQCKVLLIENKAESLKRAVKRIVVTGMNNVEFYHCNLDYFIGSFDIGVCLHACGVATDLVIQKCVEKGASFVCCPCCYGSIQSNHILAYPRSLLYHNNFNITSENYYILSHAADQTHDELNSKTVQGKLCMRLVDNDRLSYAKQMGYNTALAIMNPPSCTPKNHILVGVYER